MSLTSPITNRSRSALTLLELLVVVTILAILTIVAVQSTDYLIDQSRYSATQSTLQNIQNAIVGNSGQLGLNGNTQINGFVADMGRLPQPIDAVSDPLRELWDQTAIPAASLFNTSSSVTLSMFSPAITVQLPCGWRGPYLQPPLTQQSVGGGAESLVYVDGWGNQLNVLAADGTNAVASLAQIATIRSFGADDALDAAPLPVPDNAYNQDQYAPPQACTASAGFLTLPSPPTSFAHAGTVQVNVQTLVSGSTITVDPSSTAGDSLMVVLFMPINGVLTAVGSSTVTSTGIATVVGGVTTTPAPTNALVALTAAPTSFACTFSGVPIGSRAVQAFQFNATAMTLTKKSPLTYFILTPNSTYMQTLIIQ